MKDAAEARRCIEACATYLARVDESPLAARDLRKAVEILINAALTKRYEQIKVLFKKDTRLVKRNA